MPAIRRSSSVRSRAGRAAFCGPVKRAWMPTSAAWSIPRIRSQAARMAPGSRGGPPGGGGAMFRRCRVSWSCILAIFACCAAVSFRPAANAGSGALAAVDGRGPRPGPPKRGPPNGGGGPGGGGPPNWARAAVPSIAPTSAVSAAVRVPVDFLSILFLLCGGSGERAQNSISQRHEKRMKNVGNRGRDQSRY